MYDILFQNSLKATPLTSFVGTMSQRDGVITLNKQFFTTSNFGFKIRHRSGNWFTVSGCPMGLPLRKNLLQPGRKLWIKPIMGPAQEKKQEVTNVEPVWEDTRRSSYNWIYYKYTNVIELADNGSYLFFTVQTYLKDEHDILHIQLDWNVHNWNVKKNMTLLKLPHKQWH